MPYDKIKKLMVGISNIKVRLMRYKNRREGLAMKIKMIRGGLLAAAIVLILIGVSQHGFRDIMNKAVRICYECIGIG